MDIIFDLVMKLYDQDAEVKAKIDQCMEFSFQALDRQIKSPKKLITVTGYDSNLKSKMKYAFEKAYAHELIKGRYNVEN